MGFEFALACIPLCRITSERRAVLWGMVEKIIETYYDEDCEDFDGVALLEDKYGEKWCQVLRKAVNFLPVAEDHWRQVNHLEIMPGLPYDVLFAGGFCYGEDPSEAFGHFEVINNCEPIHAKLVEWARADKADERDY
jgi:hypothetical protein